MVLGTRDHAIIGRGAGKEKGKEGEEKKEDKKEEGLGARDAGCVGITSIRKAALDG